MTLIDLVSTSSQREGRKRLLKFFVYHGKQNSSSSASWHQSVIDQAYSRHSLDVSSSLHQGGMTGWKTTWSTRTTKPTIKPKATVGPAATRSARPGGLPKSPEPERSALHEDDYLDGAAQRDPGRSQDDQQRKGRHSQQKETRLGPDDSHPLGQVWTLVQFGLPGEEGRVDMRDNMASTGPRITPTAAQNLRCCQPS
jgi:hypothetical protein